MARDFFQEDFLQKIGGHPQAKILSQYFYTNLQERADGKIDWRFSKPGILASVEEGRAHSRWHEVEALKVPTLIIRGENSEELPPEDFRKMQKVNSLVTGVEIKGAGHWVHSDQPQEFCRVVAQFFEGVSSGRHSVPV